jgi:3-dehydroquinate synthetase
MSRDKKIVRNKFTFIVPLRLGRAAAVRDVPASVLSRVLSEVGL